MLTVHRSSDFHLTFFRRCNSARLVELSATWIVKLLGAFAKIAKSDSLVVSVRPSDCLSARNNSAYTGRIFLKKIKFDVFKTFFFKCREM